MLIMFNPRAEIGESYRMERDGRANVVHLSAFSHPNVIQGKEFIAGAVTRETTVRRINQWCRPIVEEEAIDGECFELPKFLAGQIARDQGGHEYPPVTAAMLYVHYERSSPIFLRCDECLVRAHRLKASVAGPLRMVSKILAF